ncbi:MAG: GNAT family N-acetyltransferase, partial [Methyloligellaceae bacterium]
MANGIDIRLCGKDDLEAVSKLLRETWHATYDDIYGPKRVADITSRWHSVEALERNLALPDGVFLVAERDGRIVGTGFARFEAENKLIRCDRIYVHPDAQGTGIGYGLLGEMIARTGPADRICLEVEPGNKRAIAFYERAGFRVIGQGTDCGGKG